MQDKQKVTLYLSPELHRQLKVRAAVDAEPMSSLAQRAILFYLAHPEVIEEFETVSGHTHRVYHCPDCSTPVVIRDQELVSVKRESSVIEDDLAEELQLNSSQLGSMGEGNLVTC